MTNCPSSRAVHGGECSSSTSSTINGTRKSVPNATKGQGCKPASPGDAPSPLGTSRASAGKRDHRPTASGSAGNATNGSCAAGSRHASASDVSASSGGTTRIVTTRIVYKTITRPSAGCGDGTSGTARRDRATGNAVPPGMSATLPPGVNLNVINPIPKPKRHVSLPGTTIAIDSENGISIISDDPHGGPSSLNDTPTATTMSSGSETTTSRLFRSRLPKPGRLYKTAKGVTHSKSMSALSALRGAGAKLAHHLTSMTRSRDVSPARAPDNLSISTLSSEFKACAFSYRVNEDTEVDLLGEITDEFSRRAREAVAIATPSPQLAAPKQAVKAEQIARSSTARSEPRAGCSSHATPRRAATTQRLTSTSLTSTEVDGGPVTLAPGPSQVPLDVAQKSSSFPASGRTLRERPPSSSRTNPVIAGSTDTTRTSRPPYRAGQATAAEMHFHHRHQALSPSLLQALDRYRRSSPSPSPAHPLSCCSSSSRGSSPISHSQLSVTPSEVGFDFYIQGRRRFKRAKTDLGPGGSTSQDAQTARLTEREIAKRAQHGPRQVRQLLSEIDASSDTSSIKSHKRRLVYYYTCL